MSTDRKTQDEGEQKQKKTFALVPSERETDCSHDLGFAYTGTIPCTGRRVCPMCHAEG